ncbi:MAG: hypothetical protein QXN15_00580 [Candidatus Jordarchaeales archaeon]|nr:hypothetical protein [Candidatus Jordarchaeia archaeon]
MKGKYVKYSDKVLELFYGNRDASMFLPLLKLFAEHMESVCEACMENKMVCTLRPMCPDRRWLSFLIKIGAQKRDLPSFCYKTRISEIKAIIEKSSHIHFSDAILQTDVFLNILSGGRSRLIEPLKNGDLEGFTEGLIAEFRRHIDDVSFFVGENYIFVLVEDNIFLIYLDDGFVLINPEEKTFDSISEFNDLILAVKNHYEIPIWVEEDFKGFPRILVRVPYKPDVEQALGKFVEKVADSTEHASFFRNDESFILEVEFGAINSSLTFKKVLSVLRRIRSLCQEVTRES